MAGVRVAHALFRTGSAQTVLLHPGFANTHSGIPEGGEQHMVTLIRHIEKKGTHFRGQQVGRCGPRGSGHSSQGERCCKIPPGAMGNRETRSGEFCRGMTLFMSYFSRSTRTVGWVMVGRLRTPYSVSRSGTSRPA